MKTMTPTSLAYIIRDNRTIDHIIYRTFRLEIVGGNYATALFALMVR